MSLADFHSSPMMDAMHDSENEEIVVALKRRRPAELNDQENLHESGAAPGKPAKKLRTTLPETSADPTRKLPNTMPGTAVSLFIEKYQALGSWNENSKTLENISSSGKAFWKKPMAVINQMVNSFALKRTF